MAGVEDEVPPWFGILRGDMSGMEARITASMDRMVTKDVFEAEQRVHAERHRIQDEKLREERVRAEVAEQKLAEQIDETQTQQVEAERARKASIRRLWVGIGSGVAALAALLTAVENLLHLNH